MKITVNRKSFIDALSVGGSMSGKAKTLPILEMAKVTIKDKKVIISSFDGEVAITLRSDIVDSESDMVFCVNTNDLLSILKTLKDETLVLDIDGKNCVIVHAKGRMEIIVSDSDDFPTPQRDENSIVVPINSSVLASWVRKARNFIEEDSTRPLMGCMYLYVDGGEMGCAATNAHKMYCEHITIPSAPDIKIDGVLTSKAMGALLGMLGNGSEEVGIVFSENNIAFKTSNAMLLCRKVEGRYPAFKTIIPKDGTIECKVDLVELKEALTRANLMSGMTHLLKFTIGGLNMHIESCDIDFGKKSSEDVICNVVGEDIAIAFNGLFFLDCVNSLEGNEVVISLSQPSRPIVFNEGDATFVLMPMRLK